ncbi:MAG: MFS transporter [Actinomycetota bacterium]
MIFAVAMTFIDQTIVAIAIPEIQKDLHLSATGVQWLVNAYLLALAAFFLIGGRLGDTLGHRQMVTLGVVVFTVASGLCGLTPTGDIAEAWLIVFRAAQGIGAAILLPAALAIVVGAFPVNERGRALAIFFGVAGALTSVGPILGGYLTDLDWRAIFWVNIPVALIALVLIVRAKPDKTKTPSPFDLRGAILSVAGMSLTVLGLQQASVWGWGSAETLGTVIVGLILIAIFIMVELRVANPLTRVRIFTDRAFAAENAILFLIMIAFLPLFFFSSTYAQISLGQTPSEAGLYLLTFFAGFAVASQIGGRILDERGARHAIWPGTLICAAGFYLWGDSLTNLNFDEQWYYIVWTGFGMGLIVAPANTDAINRAPKVNYAEASAITQTVRNFGASLGLAVLGTILITTTESEIGVSHQIAYAMGTRTVFYILAGVMVASFFVAVLALPGGRTQELVSEGAYAGSENPTDA